MVLNQCGTARIIALIQDGRSQYYAARVVGVSRCSVQRAIQRFRETGGYIRRVGSGRQRCTPRDDHFLTLTMLRNRDTTAVSARNELQQVRGVAVNERTGHQRVWRRPGERFAQCNIVPRVSFGGGSIMVWGGISMEARTELVVVNGGAITA
ncbi:HTH 28 domain containing protein, partial [Asbolus verrucosus]